MTLLKDHWETVVVIAAGLTGYGELRQKVKSNAVAIEKLIKMKTMTRDDCLLAQNACKNIQCIKHEQYKASVAEVKDLINSVRDDGNKQHESVMGYLMQINGK